MPTKIPHLLWKMKLIIQNILLLCPTLSQLNRVDSKYASKYLLWFKIRKTFNSGSPVK
jgi:hypothetical protein